MPSGEFRPCRKVNFCTPPSVARSREIRFGLSTPAPARPMIRRATKPFTPLASPAYCGEFVSATSTSPFGSTYSQRGWFSPVSNALTVRPGAAIGLAPFCHPTTLATFTVGNGVCTGGGNCGLGPVPAETGNVAVSEQPNSTAVPAASPTTTVSPRRMAKRCAPVMRLSPDSRHSIPPAHGPGKYGLCSPAHAALSYRPPLPP